jgi:hypothetical protein
MLYNIGGGIIMDNQSKFNELREKYKTFIYEKYDISFDDKNLNIKYYFNIPGLTYFYPEIKINKNYIKYAYDEEYLNYLVFQIGLIELISYCKCTCSKNIIVEAGYINNSQISWLKKLYYNGLGEFLYTNNIKVAEDELFEITCTHKEEKLKEITYTGEGNLICVGGGKDSCVSLELLKDEPNNSCFIINSKTPSYNSCIVAGYKDEDIVKVERILDRKIVELNKEGYLNGHTPFSSIVAFISYLCAYLMGKKNIILSNESSANEPTVIGTNINHQYSKTYEFEQDFTNYMNKYIKLDIKYFSLLRGLSEFNIARLFSHYKKYHKVFKSCNLGSKESTWKWCCNCPKCLFVYIILSPFLTKEERIEIFGEDLYERKDLLDTYLEIIGYSKTKPFECVGTYSEARLASSLVINNTKEELPYLLNYYKENFPLELDENKISKYNEENNLGTYYNKLVKEELNKYV